jgi:hypothetical protein
MAITVQALQADGTWAVRNAFITENKLVGASSLRAADLESKARRLLGQWQSTSQDGKQLRVHNSANDPAPAKRPNKFQGFAIAETADGFSWQHGGYHDTLADCQAEIVDHNSDLRSDENIYGLASIQQSIQEDIARKAGA